VAEDIKNNNQTIPKFPFLLTVCAIALGVFTLGYLAKRLGYQVWFHRASDEDLVDELFSKLLDRETKSDKAMVSVIPPPHRVFNSTEDLLKNWHNILSHWAEQEDLSTETILKDFNTILNCAEEVLNDMPYAPDLMWHEGKDPARNDLYQKTFSYFNIITLNTLSILNQRLRPKDMTSIQRSKLEDDVNVLLDTISYSSRFSRILAYRGNIEKVMSYKFPNNHWTEWTGIYPLSRFILLYNYLWKRSQRNLIKELPQLLEEGNSLIDGFYENPKELVVDSIRLLKTVTDRGRTTYDPVSRDDRVKYRMRSFYSRAFSLMGLSVTAGSIVGFVLGVPGVTLGGVSLLSVFTLGISYGAYWHPHLDVLQMKWNREMMFLVNRLKKKLGVLLNPSGAKQAVNKDQDAEVVSLARQEGLEQVRKELNLTSAPSVDMIVIISQDAGHVKHIENYVESRRKTLIRRDIPALVMTSPYEGSGNAYLDVLRRIKGKFENYRTQYPHLKPWEESRVMFIFHGTDASLDSRIESSLLDGGITNGYRAARNGSLSNGTEHKSGNLLIYTRDAYFGPIPEFPQSGITMLTSRVNRGELRAGGLVNSKFTSAGQHEVTELLEGVDVDSLLAAEKSRPREGKLLTFLKNHFNLNNPSLNQYPDLNGIFLFGPDAVAAFTQMSEYVEANHLWKKLRLSLSSDVLVPMIMGNVYDEQRETEVEEYAKKRAQWNDKDGIRKAVGSQEGLSGSVRKEVLAFYNFLNGICGKNIRINTFLPYSRSEVFIRIAGNTVDEHIKKYRTFKTDADSISDVPGGIDLSQTKERIQWNLGK
ncbi:MAG: hypothetical protein HQL15_10960, partial [Candidatus Omnitrophica bacterium]|nr:hypothetical protein [Candidatus Omnitrophota bacterium]